jgi:hypothetical protein
MKIRYVAIIVLVLCIVCGLLGAMIATRGSLDSAEVERMMKARGDSIRRDMDGRLKTLEDSLKAKYKIDTLWRSGARVIVESISVKIDSTYRDSTHVSLSDVLDLISAAHVADSACTETIGTCEARVAVAETQRDSALSLVQVESTRVVNAQKKTVRVERQLTKERWKNGVIITTLIAMLIFWK